MKTAHTKHKKKITHYRKGYNKKHLRVGKTKRRKSAKRTSRHQHGGGKWGDKFRSPSMIAARAETDRNKLMEVVSNLPLNELAVNKKLKSLLESIKNAAESARTTAGRLTEQTTELSKLAASGETREALLSASGEALFDPESGEPLNEAARILRATQTVEPEFDEQTGAPLNHAARVIS
jgi:hypothetical protein